MVAADVGATALGTGSTEPDAAAEAVRRWYEDAAKPPAIKSRAAVLRGEIEELLLSAQEVLITGHKVDGTPYLRRKVRPIRIDYANSFSSEDVLVCHEDGDWKQFRLSGIIRAETAA